MCVFRARDEMDMTTYSKYRSNIKIFHMAFYCMTDDCYFGQDNMCVTVLIGNVLQVLPQTLQADEVTLQTFLVK